MNKISSQKSIQKQKASSNTYNFINHQNDNQKYLPSPPSLSSSIYSNSELLSSSQSYNNSAKLSSNNNNDYPQIIDPETQHKIGICVFYILERRYNNRKYLCKFVLNALNNYFLEDYGSIGLKEKMGLSTLKQVKRYILQKVNACKKTGPQYINVINQYLKEHTFYGTLDIYQKNLRNIIENGNSILDFNISEVEENIDLNNKETIKSIMKQGIALLLLQHSYHPHFKSINEIWNSLYSEGSLIIPVRRQQPSSVVLVVEKAACLTNKEKNSLHQIKTPELPTQHNQENQQEEYGKTFSNFQHCMNPNQNGSGNNIQQGQSYLNYFNSNGILIFNESGDCENFDNFQYIGLPENISLQNPNQNQIQLQAQSNEYYQELPGNDSDEQENDQHEISQYLYIQQNNINIQDYQQQLQQQFQQIEFNPLYSNSSSSASQSYLSSYFPLSVLNLNE